MSTEPVRELASAVSLAVRIEPHLLRAARLALLPNLDAGAEADLWFSSFVQSRNPLGIVLRHEVLSDLRSELKNSGRLDRAYEIVRRIHYRDPPTLQLEERLTWLGLGGGGGTDEAERLLEQAVFSMVEEDREGIARWSSRAFERLPASVRLLEAGRMLDIGSKARLGVSITPGEVKKTDVWFAWVAPAFPTIEANVRLLEGGIELGLNGMDGAKEIRVADTKPPYVDVSWPVGTGRRSTRVTLTSGSPVVVETGASSVRIQSALGRTWELAPRPLSLEVEFPDSMQVDTAEWLLVSIVNAAPTDTGLAIDVPAGESIDVLVQPRRGFNVENDAPGTFEVPESGESLPLQFKLKALDEGKGLIRVLAFHLGEPLGVIELEPSVTAASTSRGSRPPSPGRRAKASPFPASPQIPDLSMFIEEREAGGALEFLIRVTATDPALKFNLRPFGPFRLEVEPAKIFETFFQGIDELPLETKEQRDVAERRLAAMSTYLTESLMPRDLREALWAIRDKITSVILQSEEPWIPWELCRLLGRDGDRVIEGPFLCEAFALTRWLPGAGFKRPLRLTNLALVVPAGSGLPLATDERDFVLSLAGDGRAVTAIDATFRDVQNAFAAGVYDGMHFTGHGMAKDSNPDRSSIILGGGESFTPEDVSGKAGDVGIPHPLVFINACQVGRGGMGLTGVGAWARRFVQTGAGAFIGPYWSVNERAAFQFAKELYRRLLDGMPIGHAVREARARVRANGDPSWLAYTVFADPLATVEPPSSSPSRQRTRDRRSEPPAAQP